MSPADMDALTTAINARNAATIKRVERRVVAFGKLLAAIALAFLGAWLLLRYAEPCEGADLCLAAAPAAAGWWRRVRMHLRAAYLRRLRRWAAEDLRNLRRERLLNRLEARAIPQRMHSHVLYIERCDSELASLDLDLRRF